MQPFTQQPLILYEIETVPVPIVDKTPKQTPIWKYCKETIYSIKFQNIYKYTLAGISHLQKNRL